MLLVAQPQAVTALKVPAQANAGLIGQRIEAACVPVGGADLTVPRVPPATDRHLAARHVGIDEGPAEPGRYVRRDVAVKNVVVEIDTRSPGLVIAIQADRQIGRASCRE